MQRRATRRKKADCRPVSSAASPTPRPKKGDLSHVKRPVTREAEQATDARSHLHTDHQDCDPIFAAWLPPPDGPWRPRLAHVDPSRDAPPPHLALLSSQTTNSFSSCHHGIPSRLPLRPRADSLGRSLSLSPADPFSPVRLWSSSCLRPRFEYLAQPSSRDALYVHLFPHRPSPRSKYLIRPALPLVCSSPGLPCSPSLQLYDVDAFYEQAFPRVLRRQGRILHRGRRQPLLSQPVHQWPHRRGAPRPLHKIPESLVPDTVGPDPSHACYYCAV